MPESGEPGAPGTSRSASAGPPPAVASTRVGQDIRGLDRRSRRTRRNGRTRVVAEGPMGRGFRRVRRLRLRSEEHTSELQSPYEVVCRLLLEKKNTPTQDSTN